MSGLKITFSTKQQTSRNGQPCTELYVHIDKPNGGFSYMQCCKVYELPNAYVVMSAFRNEPQVVFPLEEGLEAVLERLKEDWLDRRSGL